MSTAEIGECVSFAVSLQEVSKVGYGQRPDHCRVYVSRSYNQSDHILLLILSSTTESMTSASSTTVAAAAAEHKM